MYREQRIIQLTEDGSHTIAVPALNVTYHSRYGAVQESLHVFIRSGLNYFMEKNKPKGADAIRIFEMGFGTGLNALLSLQFAIQHNQKIVYQAIEPYPCSIQETMRLNYAALINENLKESFHLIHQCNWDKEVDLHALFSFQKIKMDLEPFETPEQFHIIYFDAFDPNAQPELWTGIIFKKMFDMLYTSGVLVTYCSKGIVRRAMQAAGFSIEKLPGPPHKREITRALKI